MNTVFRFIVSNHVFMYHETCQTKTLTGKKLIQRRKIESIESDLEQCQSGEPGAVILRKELDLCLDDLNDEQN